MNFKVKDSDLSFTVFTTRADTISVLPLWCWLPKASLAALLTTEAQRAEVDNLFRTKKKTERERIADRRVTGVFSGSYAINPITEEAIPSG
jgi:leucyl-tRNA synthetase